MRKERSEARERRMRRTSEREREREKVGGEDAVLGVPAAEELAGGEG